MAAKIGPTNIPPSSVASTSLLPTMTSMSGPLIKGGKIAYCNVIAFPLAPPNLVASLRPRGGCLPRECYLCLTLILLCLLRAGETAALSWRQSVIIRRELLAWVARARHWVKECEHDASYRHLCPSMHVAGCEVDIAHGSNRTGQELSTTESSSSRGHEGGGGLHPRLPHDHARL